MLGLFGKEAAQAPANGSEDNAYEAIGDESDRSGYHRYAKGHGHTRLIERLTEIEQGIDAGDIRNRRSSKDQDLRNSNGENYTGNGTADTVTAIPASYSAPK